MTPFAALLTGLTVGGLTCLTVQGGLLLGLLARRTTDDDTSGPTWRRLLIPVGAFLAAKIIAHTILGLGLGWLGQSITLSTTARIWLQAIAAMTMLIAGIRLLKPGFLPWLQLTPPAGMRRFIRQRAKGQDIFAPAVLGLMTVFIPCGTTQAMEIAAIATGDALRAATIMFAFTIGTAPLFILVGLLARGTAIFQRRLSIAAALLVIGLGLYAFNGVLVASGSNYSMQNIIQSTKLAFQGEPEEYSPTDAGGKATTTPTINVSGTGYTPDHLTVPAGQLVTITLKGGSQIGCASSFRIPKLKLDADVPPNGSTTLAATFPKAGRYEFSCSMGMFRGVITAV